MSVKERDRLVVVRQVIETEPVNDNGTLYGIN